MNTLIRYVAPLISFTTFLVFGIAQLVAAFVGIEHTLGLFWALIAFIVAFVWRFTLPITIGAFFGAMNVWGWHWTLATLFVAPGLLFVFTAVLAVFILNLKEKMAQQDKIVSLPPAVKAVPITPATSVFKSLGKIAFGLLASILLVVLVKEIIYSENQVLPPATIIPVPLVSPMSFAGDTLYPDQRLRINGSIVSNNGCFRLIFQEDSNLVLYNRGGQPFWASDTMGEKALYVILQTDGSFVMYGEGGVPKWDSKTMGKGGTKVIAQDDGNVVMYTDEHEPVWATNTDGAKCKISLTPFPVTSPSPTVERSEPLAIDKIPLSQPLTNSIGMEFVLIPVGRFMMGANLRDQGADSDEYPRHEVSIASPFYMGKYEVTQEQWKKVMGNNPAYFKNDKVSEDFRRHPVESVSWNEIQEFIKRLNALEKTNKYRLPTEAEWEYAQRGGATQNNTVYFFGDDTNQLGEYAWFRDNSNKITHPVGQKKPNPFGLYDILGNVWEWTCSSHTDQYDGSELKCNITDDGRRVLRGGSWSEEPNWMRSANRVRGNPTTRNNVRGFRVVGFTSSLLTIEQAEDMYLSKTKKV